MPRWDLLNGGWWYSHEEMASRQVDPEGIMQMTPTPMTADERRALYDLIDHHGPAAVCDVLAEYCGAQSAIAGGEARPLAANAWCSLANDMEAARDDIENNMPEG